MDRTGQLLLDRRERRSRMPPELPLRDADLRRKDFGEVALSIDSDLAMSEAAPLPRSLTPGAVKNAEIEIDGAELDGVHQATPFLSTANLARADLPSDLAKLDVVRRVGARFQWLVAPMALIGDALEQLTAVRAQRVRLGAPDRSGRPRPEPIS